METIQYGGRNTGRFIQSIYAMARVLLGGGSVGIMAIKEDAHIDRVVKALKECAVADVRWKRLTRKDPTNNIEILFDEWSEPIGVEILEQTDKFVGWKVWCGEEKN